MEDMHCYSQSFLTNTFTLELEEDHVIGGIAGKKTQDRSTYSTVGCGGTVAFLPFSSLANYLKLPSRARAQPDHLRDDIS